MQTISTKTVFVFLMAIPFLSACSKPPAEVFHELFRAQVIGKENCKGSDTADDWLIDISVYPYNAGQYGDTVTYNGRFYSKAIKLKGLDKSLQIPGIKVAIECESITDEKVVSTGCTVANPTIYPLREVTIFVQGGASF